ncbi:Gti1/Pac2 family-domain-containing protein [Crepidotus variabilis]|uniref:Gti1/Pac2 family-domain-containing protein n=1 Tax=Crepidotus variabilis TaxID=179855 RepID=A0A9P6JP07_9AGAR|nr:Gti1/Pac2 family-domain-containing protein [Crepidotus variabilis]
MQQPTCTNVRIRSTADAHKIFSAIQQGLLQMVTRRLDADERLALRSGCIYAWEERGPHTETTGLGIERFTEGRRWSPSRVRDEFLFYYEKYSPPPDLNNPGNKSSEPKPPRDWDPLVKQTYSVWVDTEKGRRKWHLTAYFTQATIDQLGTIDDIARVRGVAVPDGMFKSTRVGKSRSNRADDNKTADLSRAATSRTFAPFPSPYQYQSQKGSPSMTPVFMHEPYQNNNHPPEPHSPSYEHSPSPASPQMHGNYAPSNGAYSHHPSTPSYSSDYQQSPMPLPHAIPASNHQTSYSIPPPQPSSQGYYSTNTSPSWNSHNTYYGGQRSSEVSPPPTNLPSPTSSASPPNSTYHAVTSHSPHAQSPYPYPTQIPPMQTNSSQFYSTSYSLNSALTPLPPPHSAPPLHQDYRGGQSISPLQIPDRSNSGHHYQGSTLSPIGQPTSHSGGDGIDISLAPLNLLKRQIRYRREPADEKTLRLLPSLPFDMQQQGMIN